MPLSYRKCAKRQRVDVARCGWPPTTNPPSRRQVLRAPPVPPGEGQQRRLGDRRGEAVGGGVAAVRSQRPSPGDGGVGCPAPGDPSRSSPDLRSGCRSPPGCAGSGPMQPALRPSLDGGAAPQGRPRRQVRLGGPPGLAAAHRARLPGGGRRLPRRVRAVARRDVGRRRRRPAPRPLDARVAASPRPGAGLLAAVRDGLAAAPDRTTSPSCSATCRRCARRDLGAALRGRAAARCAAARGRRWRRPGRRGHRHACCWPRRRPGDLDPAFGPGSAAASTCGAAPSGWTSTCPGCGATSTRPPTWRPPWPWAPARGRGPAATTSEPRRPRAAGCRPCGPGDRAGQPGPAALPWARAGHRRAFRPGSVSGDVVTDDGSCCRSAPRRSPPAGCATCAPGSGSPSTVEGTGADCVVVTMRLETVGVVPTRRSLP